MDLLSKHIYSIVNSIRSYTNRAYIGDWVYKGMITVVDGIIVSPIYLDIHDNDIIEITGQGIFLGTLGIKDGEYNAEVYEVSLPMSIEMLLSLAQCVDTTLGALALKREAIGDANYTLNTGKNDVAYGLPITVQSILAKDRKMPGGIKKELLERDIGR